MMLLVVLFLIHECVPVLRKFITHKGGLRMSWYKKHRSVNGDYFSIAKYRDTLGNSAEELIRDHGIQGGGDNNTYFFQTIDDTLFSGIKEEDMYKLAGIIAAKSKVSGEDEWTVDSDERVVISDIVWDKKHLRYDYQEAITKDTDNSSFVVTDSQEDGMKYLSMHEKAFEDFKNNGELGDIYKDVVYRLEKTRAECKKKTEKMRRKVEIKYVKIDDDDDIVAANNDDDNDDKNNDNDDDDDDDDIIYSTDENEFQFSTEEEEEEEEEEKEEEDDRESNKENIEIDQHQQVDKETVVDRLNQANAVMEHLFDQHQDRLNQANAVMEHLFLQHQQFRFDKETVDKLKQANAVMEHLFDQHQQFRFDMEHLFEQHQQFKFDKKTVDRLNQANAVMERLFEQQQIN